MICYKSIFFNQRVTAYSYILFFFCKDKKKIQIYFHMGLEEGQIKPRANRILVQTSLTNYQSTPKNPGSAVGLTLVQNLVFI